MCLPAIEGGATAIFRIASMALLVIYLLFIILNKLDIKYIVGEIPVAAARGRAGGGIRPGFWRWGQFMPGRLAPGAHLW